jgi:TolA-binding protein
LHSERADGVASLSDLPPLSPKAESEEWRPDPEKGSPTTLFGPDLAESGDVAPANLVRKPSLTEQALRIAQLPPPLPTSSDEGASKLEEAIQTQYEIIEAKLERGREDEAKREFLQLATDFPDSSFAPRALCQAWKLEKSDIRKRIEGFVRIVEEYPFSPQATESLLEIGDSRLHLGDHEGAVDAFRAYQIRQGEGHNHPRLRVKIAQSLLSLRRHEEALREVDRLIAEHPESRDADRWLDLRSECQMALERFPEAVITLRELLHQYPNYALRPKVMLAMGLCYEAMGQADAAKKAYLLIGQNYPPNRDDTPFETLAAVQRLQQLSQPLFAPTP